MGLFDSLLGKKPAPTPTPQPGLLGTPPVTKAVSGKNRQGYITYQEEMTNKGEKAVTYAEWLKTK